MPTVSTEAIRSRVFLFARAGKLEINENVFPIAI